MPLTTPSIRATARAEAAATTRPAARSSAALTVISYRSTGAGAAAGAEGAERDAEGHAAQPAGQRLAAADRNRLAGQHQEGRLKGVLGQVVIRQDAATDAEHERPVPPHQRRERLGVAAGGEALEQPAVA